MKLLAAFLFCCLVLIACKDDDKKKGQNSKGEKMRFDHSFHELTVPYQVSDTALLQHVTSMVLPFEEIAPLVSDNIKKSFAKPSAIKYSALGKLIQKDKESYYVLKASDGDSKAAIVLVYDAEYNPIASYPLLIIDKDPSTLQSSTIDKKYIITKNITKRNGSDIVAEGKEVVAWDASEKAFSIIMTDALNNPEEVINPIDTFSRTHKLAGDYYLNKKNFVAIRDGRHPNQLLVYIHTQNEAGDCRGELKGEFLITSANSATYRLGGDPCVLNLSFSGNKVSIQEESGCGNHRDLDCPLSGTFTRKKVVVPKQPSKKK